MNRRQDDWSGRRHPKIRIEVVWRIACRRERAIWTIL